MGPHRWPWPLVVGRDGQSAKSQPDNRLGLGLALLRFPREHGPETEAVAAHGQRPRTNDHMICNTTRLPRISTLVQDRIGAPRLVSQFESARNDGIRASRVAAG